jgi:hypothetical protein
MTAGIRIMVRTRTTVTIAVIATIVNEAAFWASA